MTKRETIYTTFERIEEEVAHCYFRLHEHFISNPPLAKFWADAALDERDGLRLAWPDRWVHLRPSGTEPVIRVIAEAPSEAEARRLLEDCEGLL